MANYDVGFTISADTQPAGKALLQLSRLINDAISKADKAVKNGTADKGIINQQKEYKKLAKVIETAVKADESLTRAELERGNINKLETKLAGIDTSTKDGKKKAADIQEQITLKEQQLKVTNDLAAQVLKQVLGEKELVVSDKEALGIKLQERQVSEATTEATTQAAEANKAAKVDAQGEAKALDEARKAAEGLGEAQKETASQATPTPKQEGGAGKGTVDTEGIKDLGEAAEEELGPIAQLVQEINEIRLTGGEATEQVKQLTVMLREFDTSTANAGQLNRYLDDIDEAVKLIKKDLGDTNRLDDVFDIMKRAAAPAKQALQEINAEGKKTGNEAVQTANKMAAQQKQVTMAYLLAGMEAQRRAEERAASEAKIAAQDERRYRERTAWVTAMVALGEQMAAAEEEEARRETQARQNYLTSILAVYAQQKQAEQDAIAFAQETAAKMETALNQGVGAGDISALTQQLSALQQAKAGLEELGIPEGTRQTYNQLYGQIAQVKDEIKAYNAEMNRTEETSETFKNGLKSLPSVVSVVKNGFSSLQGVMGKIKSSFDKMASSMKSNFKHMLTNITKYVFGFRSLFFLVRRMRKYIGEGIQSMAKFRDGNNSVNANISKLITSLEYLKNAWATAFSPILSFITPWLSALIDKLASVGNAFSRFLGNLLGVGKVFQAVKGPTKNYAKSLDKAKKSAGGAAKKQKELNDRLADFDVLHVLGKDNDNKGSGSGSGNDDDEDKKRNNKLWKLAKVAADLKKKLQEMWAEGDFTALGETIAKGLKKAFENLNAKMPEILKTAEKVGKSIATFFNGLLSDPSLFEEMGKFAANLGNIFVKAFAGFFANYEKGSIGTAIATFFKGLFENYDWKTSGSNLGQFVTALFTELATLLREFPTDEFISGLEDFLYGINWEEVIASLFRLLAASASFIGKILKGIGDIMNEISSDDIVEAFSQIDWEDVAEGFGDLLAGVLSITLASVKFGFVLATAIVKGIANSLTDAMKNAGVLDKFIEGIQEGGPAGWLKAGTALIEGLWKGILDAAGNVKDWVDEHIKTPIVEGFKSLFNIHSPSKVMEELGTNLIDGLIAGISAGIEPIKQKWEDIKGAIKGKIDQLKVDLALAWDNIKTDMETKFNLIKDKVIEIWNGIKDGLKKPVNGIISIVESCINKMISGINAIAKKLNDLPSLEFKNPFTGKDYKLGFKIPELSKVSIPRLAQGAVIPPNREFLATLGDQSHGTNIEAPLDTIKQAVAEVMANNTNAEVVRLLQQLIGVVESKNLVIGDKDIGKANARYNNQQRLIRGTSF